MALDEPIEVEDAGTMIALERIDDALRTCSGRNLVPVDEFTDVLLDVRSLIATKET